ncbi:MAG: hypothetical protein CSA89_00940 [Bacteroidales bacterium]|nr:MAG: hypothetical protein CSA89_00940 [Bacteroidales bacterium]
MKRIILFATAVVTFAFTACNGGLKTTEKLTNELDSVNYAFGVANGAGFKGMFAPEDATDENFKAMLKGFADGFKETSDDVKEKNEAITAGIQFRQSIQQGFLLGDSSLVINEEVMFSAIDSMLEGETEVNGFSKETANQYFFKMYQELRNDTLPSQKVSQSKLDSLSTAYAVMQSANYTAHINDSNRSEFVKNFKKGRDITSSTERFEYLGRTMAISGYNVFSDKGLLGDSTLTLEANLMVVGLNAGTLGDTTIFTPDSARDYLRQVDEKRREARNMKLYGEWKKQNEEYLVEVAQNDNLHKTESGLLYEVLKTGKGAMPTATDRVKVHYKGMLIDGTEFDSSYERKQPTEFGVNQVIKGWIEGLQLMPVGSKYKFYIPQYLAYGGNSAGDVIKPFSTLVFEVELLDIVK